MSADSADRGGVPAERGPPQSQGELVADAMIQNIVDRAKLPSIKELTVVRVDDWAEHRMVGHTG